MLGGRLLDTTGGWRRQGRGRFGGREELSRLGSDIGGPGKGQDILALDVSDPLARELEATGKSGELLRPIQDLRGPTIVLAKELPAPILERPFACGDVARTTY